jgi:hypothetical protein
MIFGIFTPIDRVSSGSRWGSGLAKSGLLRSTLENFGRHSSKNEKEVRKP